MGGAAAADAATRARQVLAGLGPVRHLIGGEMVDSVAGGTFDDVCPADNAVLAAVADGRAADVDRAVAAARAAFDTGPWGRADAAERSRALHRIADAIMARAEDLALLESLDTGLPIRQTRGQIARAANNFRFFADRIRRPWGEHYPSEAGLHNYAIRRPVGVAGLITPWNTPLMLETWKIAPCLAAGNACVLKPAEWSPLSAFLLARIIQETDLPRGAFNMVQGFGESCGAPLVAHAGVQLISFTGETVTGSEIMRTGAATLKRFSMELGGKSPVVVFADADFDAALDAVVFGVYSLNGERCTAGSRLLVQAPLYERFVAAVAERVARVRVGDPFAEATEVGPLIHRDHQRRVLGYLELGRREGARLLVGGGVPPGLDAGNYVEPTLFADARQEMRIVQEEIFGPALVAMPFADEAEAIRLANGVRYGLAAYVWTRDLERAHRVAQSVASGMVWVNSHNVRDLRTPFGGSKDSGIGREGGDFSFEFYMETQSVQVALARQTVPRFGAGA